MLYFSRSVHERVLNESRYIQLDAIRNWLPFPSKADYSSWHIWHTVYVIACVIFPGFMTHKERRTLALQLTDKSLASVRLTLLWDARLTHPLRWWINDWQVLLGLSDGTALCHICLCGWNLFRHMASSLVCGLIQCLPIHLGYITGNWG